MLEAMAKIIQAGNSLAVTIPANFIKKIGARAGDEVKVQEQPARGKITYTFKNMRQLPLLK